MAPAKVVIPPAPATPYHGPTTGRRPNILLGLTGSVAAIKAAELAVRLAEFADVRVLSTERADHFLRLAPIPVNETSLACLNNSDDWSAWSHRGDPVVHIELRRWADLLLVAPLSANTLAKISTGLCDNLLTCVARAWDFNRPYMVAPAMNTCMWEHPITAEQIRKLRSWGVIVLEPISKTLACGDTGMGAMMEVDSIVANVKRFLS